jgi:hypothetical protein
MKEFAFGLIISSTVILATLWGMSKLVPPEYYPIIPYQAPTLTQDSAWPALFYMRGPDGEYRAYLLAEPAETEGDK